MDSLQFASAVEVVKLIKSGELSPVDLIRETLKRIEEINPALNAFVALRAEEALEEARVMTERLAAGEDPGPLAGIPLAVKDMEDVRDMVTSYGSLPYRNLVAKADSIQVARLRAAGAIVVGKTNTPEFGYTAFTKNRLFGVTRNPWNLEKTPGGSSGGSAAAVAAGMVSLATGSDAGGSVRIPACYCGCFGLKPSFGRIPIGPAPLLPLFHTTCMGPLTRTVSDAALYLDCTAGYHPADPTSSPTFSMAYLKGLRACPRKMHIAFSMTLGYARVEGDVRANVMKAAEAFQEMGHVVEEWKEALPNAGEAWSRITDRELYGMLHRSLERNRTEFGRALVAGLDRAASTTILGLIEDQGVRTELNRILWDLFDRFDLLLTPTMPTEPFAAGGPPPSMIDGQPANPLDATPFTYPFNLSGHPAASVPAGFGRNGLPVGLQIVGPRHRDDLVLQAAFAYEQVRPWRDQVPMSI